MKKLNRVVNVLTLVLAVAIVVFGFLLFTKRYQLRDRGDRMAAAIEKVAVVLDDKENGSVPWASDMKGRKSDCFTSEKYPSERFRAVRLPLAPRKPDAAGAGGVSECEAEENSKSTLYHDNYNTPRWLLRKRYPAGIPDDVKQKEANGLNLQRQLDFFIAQAKDIILQRNSLGDTLKSVADKLCLPEAFERKQFYSVKSYADRARKMVEFSEAVNRRDDMFVDYFTRIGDSIKKQVATDLGAKSRELKFDDLAAALDKLVGDAGKLRKRSDSYADTIASMTRSLGAAVPGGKELLDDEYADALNQAERLAKEFKDEFGKTTAELGRTRLELDDTRQQLADKERQFNELSKSFATAQKTIKTLKTILYNPDASQEITQDNRYADLYLQLTGTIVEVNRKWDFVVIDLGKSSMFKRSLRGGKIQVVKAPLPSDKELYVARGGQFIAKIKVVKVDDNCAVANVTSGPRGGRVEVGDKVFFPPPPPHTTVGDKEGDGEGDGATTPSPDVGMN